MDKEKYLEDKPITDEELQKLKETLPKNQKIVEVTPQHFKILTRLKE